jgi:YD repeat-containing protein
MRKEFYWCVVFLVMLLSCQNKKKLVLNIDPTNQSGIYSAHFVMVANHVQNDSVVAYGVDSIFYDSLGRIVGRVGLTNKVCYKYDIDGNMIKQKVLGHTKYEFEIENNSEGDTLFQTWYYKNSISADRKFEALVKYILSNEYVMESVDNFGIRTKYQYNKEGKVSSENRFDENIRIWTKIFEYSEDGTLKRMIFLDVNGFSRIEEYLNGVILKTYNTCSTSEFRYQQFNNLACNWCEK